MVNGALDSRFSSLGLSPDWGHSVVFLGKSLYSCSASLHPGVQMGRCTSEFKVPISSKLFFILI